MPPPRRAPSSTIDPIACRISRPSRTARPTPKPPPCPLTEVGRLHGARGAARAGCGGRRAIGMRADGARDTVTR
eukprot:3591075-Pyramimonas_sp.AAC.1